MACDTAEQHSHQYCADPDEDPRWPYSKGCAPGARCQPGKGCSGQEGPRRDEGAGDYVSAGVRVPANGSEHKNQQNVRDGYGYPQS